MSTHFDDQGNAHMVDVTDKPTSDREAIAEGWITLGDEAAQVVASGTAKKGDVLAVAQLAGISAAKRTSELIPLCHPLPLTGVRVTLSQTDNTVHVVARVRCTWRTGVEMEALTCVSAALLTVYDMVKGIDKAPVIGPIQLCEKRGGRSGEWVRAPRP